MSKEHEEWKLVEGYEDVYEVSNLGRVKSLKRKRVPKDRILNQRIDADGYPYTGLTKNNVTTSKVIHRLMAQSFLNHTINRKMVVDHINNVKTDNRLENLQIISHRENCSKDKKTNKTGAFYDKYNKAWRSTICINYKRIHLGNFKTEIEASNAYQKALKQLL